MNQTALLIITYYIFPIPSFKFLDEPYNAKTRVLWLSIEDFVILACVILKQCQNVKDGQTTCRSLDKSVPSNYRPISNLKFISKVLERLFLSRFQPHILDSPNFNRNQLAH